MLPIQHCKNPNIIVIFTDDEGWGATSVQTDDQVLNLKGILCKLRSGTLSSQRDAFCQWLHLPSQQLTFRYAATENTADWNDDIIERPGQETDPKRRLRTPPNVRMINSNEITIGEIINNTSQLNKTAYFGKWHLGNNGSDQHVSMQVMEQPVMKR